MSSAFPISNNEHSSHDPFLKIPHYCNEVLRASGEEKNLLALCWRLAADAARNYSRQCQANYILSPQEPLDLEKKAQQLKIIQEANYRKTIALDASPKKDFSPHWIFSVDALREAAWSYRHWMIFSEARNSPCFEQELKQSKEAVFKYSAPAPEASRWSEKAFQCFYRAQQIQQSGSSPLEKEWMTHRWKTAAYEAVHVAIMQLHFTAATAWNNKILIDHWSEAVKFSARAFDFRIKAAEATQDHDEKTAMQWSLAAYAASNVCDGYTKLIEILPSSKKKLIALWKNMLQAAEQAMKRRERSASAVANAKNFLDEAAFWSEHSYDCHVKRLELYLDSSCSIEEKKIIQTAWEKIIHEATGIANRWDQLAQKSNKAKIPFWNYLTRKKIHQREYKNRKKIFNILWKELEPRWQELSFCLGEPFFPDEECMKTWEQGKLFPKIEFTCSHSWIYQTATFLQQAGIPCDLSRYQKKQGIMIALCAAAPASFGADPPLSSDVFLVDVVADSLPHPAAHFYILQNPVHAQQVPHSLFMPHWPQSRLIPRASERGARFENIVFFGDIDNLAPEIASATWIRRVKEELGLTFTIQLPEEWNDYSKADCVVAIRDFSTSQHLHKPATKLYNAWLAGVPFIGGRDAAYAFEGQSGKNYLVAHSLEELFQHLKHLKEDVLFRKSLVEHGSEASSSITKAAILERWKILIQETLPALAREHQKKIEKKRRRILFLNSVFHWVNFKISLK